MKIISPCSLKQSGILGINSRNRDYIARYNKRKYYPYVDDKLKTKLLADVHGIPVPALKSIIRTQHDINLLDPVLSELNGFAVKPSRGSGGKGIWIIKEQKNGSFIKSSGAVISKNDFKRHLSNIVAGLYSLNGSPDVVIVEDIIRISSVFSDYSYEGVPDIRIIVFKGYPVMAMLRLATRVSDGKANLHQGAVGVGIDIATGSAVNAVWFSKTITRHPDSDNDIRNIKIPGWKKILELASGCYEMSGLGYIGADIVIDKTRGAQLLELNARPGLSIQVANGAGLIPRLKLIESVQMPFGSAKERVRFSIRNFGNY
ncbi:MAG: alpha-L-glutamate ligase-like protein [Spirochaetes bacterium]|nr:alpha-L-glutamate ligase-like protein [Spirochaetota bacterium]MBN2771798.1 alpha-L-glutamate ligase-like protein [Spirochaetota bacterium]